MSFQLFAFQVLRGLLPFLLFGSLIGTPDVLSASVGFKVSDAERMERFSGPPPRNAEAPKPWPPRFDAPSHKLLKTGYQILDRKRMVVSIHKEIAG